VSHLKEEILPVKMKALVYVALAALAAAAVVGVVKAKPADARPNQQKDCTQCHGDGTYAATVTATPSSATVAPGATYTVGIIISEDPSGTFNTGYWIANSTAAGATGTSTGVYGGNTGTQQSHTATMTAPAAPGTYYYKAFGVDGPADNTGVVGFKVYSITVVAPVHDVAVDYLGQDPRVRRMSVGDVGGFFATYANLGNVGETFTATLTAKTPSSSTSTLDTRSVTLAAGATTTVYYPGVLTYSSAGVWTITATAGPVAGETNTDDNTWVRPRTVVASATLAVARRAHRGR
jgi:hypothetical protein